MTTRKPIVQVLAGLDTNQGTPEDVFRTAIQTSLNWLKNKQRVRVPAKAFEGQPFELDLEDGQPVAVETVGNYWACQFDKLDPATAGRIWRTELSIAHSADGAFAGVRLTVLDTADAPKPIVSIPRVVGGLATSPGLTDAGVRLGPGENLVASAAQLQTMVDLLVDPRRQAPVVVFSEGEGVDYRTEASAAAESLAGLAHVYALPASLASSLIEVLGREFALWNGAVRTYFPRFNPLVDESMAHPVATRAWLQRRFPSIKQFLQALLFNFASRSVSGDADSDDLPSFRAVRSASLTRRLQELGEQAKQAQNEAQGPFLQQQIELLEEQLKAKDLEVTEQKQLFSYADEEEKRAKAEREDLRALNMALRARIESLEEKLEIKSSEIEIPDTFDVLEDWVKTNFPDRLVVRTRAIRAAKKSGYQNPGLVYQCLVRLAREYRDCRRNGKPYEGLFRDLRVQLERTGSESEASQWDVRYFDTNSRGVNTFLDWHIKQGSDKNDQTTLRIYFYYDDEDEVVVVGHLPTHLRNAKT